jgi:hypothetical protein
MHPDMIGRRLYMQITRALRRMPPAIPILRRPHRRNILYPRLYPLSYLRRRRLLIVDRKKLQLILEIRQSHLQLRVMRHQLVKLLSLGRRSQPKHITFNYAALYVQLDIHTNFFPWNSHRLPACIAPPNPRYSCPEYSPARSFSPQPAANGKTCNNMQKLDHIIVNVLHNLKTRPLAVPSPIRSFP